MHNWLALKFFVWYRLWRLLTSSGHVKISNAPYFWCCCPFLTLLSLLSLSICFPLLHSECYYHSYLTEAERRMSYYNGFNGYLQCDNLLPFGWYRFGGAAGTEMPTSCVGKNRCGTHAPGWLNGSHPRATDGIVRAKVCFHWSYDCCLWSANIRVRNCSGFYVYELVPPPNCHLRYCGNGGGKTDRRKINVEKQQTERKTIARDTQISSRQTNGRETNIQKNSKHIQMDKQGQTNKRQMDRPTTECHTKNKVKSWDSVQ